MDTHESVNNDSANDVNLETADLQPSGELEAKEITVSRKRIPRGLAPPLLSLIEAIDVIVRFYEEAGGESSFDLLARITDNSPASSVFSKKVAALRNYNLIEDENRIVRLSPLGFRITAPHEPAERMEAAKEAFLNVEIFAKAYDRYKGRILPQDEFLTNAFGSYYVPRELAGEWVEKFKASLDAAGLLEERNGKPQVRETVLIPREVQELPPPVEVKEVEPIKESVAPLPTLVLTSPDVIRTPLPLGPGRLAYIELPNDWKPSELKKLLRLLALSLGDVEDEQNLGL